MTFVSNVCRISQEIVDRIAAEVTLLPGINTIPEGVLAPRQVKIIDPDLAGYVPATLKPHRGSMIATISRDQANNLVRAGGIAQWCPQSLLCYSMDEYIADPDVQADTAELARAKEAKYLDSLEGGGSGELLVVAVAVIGDNRSSLSVCRNIVSGCQKMDRLTLDAAGALESSNIFLVED